MKNIFLCLGGNHIAGGDIDGKGHQDGIESGIQHHPVTAIIVILPDGADGSYRKADCIPTVNSGNFLQCSPNGLRRQRQISQRGIQVHGCPVMKPYHGGHQHAALQHEFIPVR